MAGQFFERISQYVESEISVTAMAVQKGEEQMVLCSADLVGIDEWVLQLAREELAKICPEVAPQNLMVAATHTHTSLKIANNAPQSRYGRNTVSVLQEFLPADKMYKPMVTTDASVITPEESAFFAAQRIANEIISVFEEITDLQCDGEFSHKVLNVELPLRQATMAEYDLAVRELEHYVEKNKDKASFDYADNAKMYIYAGTIMRYRLQQKTQVYPMESHVIRLGNIAFATNPFELFLDYGNQIKARSYAEQTFIVQLCNGIGGYLPTENAEKAGHYSAYISSGNVGHEGGDLLVRWTLSEIQKLWE